MKNLLYIGNQLSQNGKTVTTIESLSACFRQEGYTVYTASEKTNKVVRLLDMLYHVFKYRRQVDYVLIDTYSTQNFYYAYLTSVLCRQFNLKYIPILHGGNLVKRLKENSRLSKTIFQYAYNNISPSLYLKSSFKMLGYDNVAYIPNSIKLIEYPYKKREYVKLNLFWLRSFSKIYNPNLAIEVLGILKQKGVDASLCMVGPENDGSLEKSKKYAEELKVDVKFTGKLSKPEWIELSEEYNIFINTTNFDNMPVSVIESMAIGLPVISTNVGGIPFLIENEIDGVLVEPNNAQLFVNAIEEIYNNPDKAHAIIQNARKKVEQFDWDQVKEKWFKLLK